MTNILIIGHGIVGSNLEKELEIFTPDIIDKYKPDENRISINSTNQGYDIAFICVNTPFTPDSPCDWSEVLNAINENKDSMNENGIFVIKSTILPGTTEKIRNETKQKVIFSPEYYGSTPHCNNYDFDFTILGGEREDCITVAQTLQKVYDARHQFRCTDSKTAELVKYMENSWLATKVSFCTQFYDIAEKESVDYEELRELFIMDPRVNPSHTFVYRDTPYWDSHCLNKDVPAITINEDAEFLNAVIRYNENRKKIANFKKNNK